MKHILNEMSEEEKDSIRSQHTGTLKVQTERFKKLVENKLGNAKPLVSEQFESFTAFDEQAPERRVKDMDSGKITGTHKYGVGYTPNEFGKSLGHSSHPTSIPNYSKFDDDDEEYMSLSRMDEDNSDYRMYDLPEIHQSIEDEIEGMSDDEAIEFLKETIEFCEDKLNGYDFEDDTLNEQSTEDVNKGKKTGCYTVKSGDTVLAIANKFGITLDDVRALNGMTSTNSITPGQKLRVKNGTKFIGC